MGRDEELFETEVNYILLAEYPVMPVDIKVIVVGYHLLGLFLCCLHPNYLPNTFTFPIACFLLKNRAQLDTFLSLTMPVW